MTVNGTGPSSLWTSATTFVHDLDGMKLGFSNSSDGGNSRDYCRLGQVPQQPVKENHFKEDH